MRKLNIGAGISSGILGILGGIKANSMLVSITSGLWTIEEGAPWTVIYGVFILPAIISLCIGLTNGYVKGILCGVFSAFIIAFILYIACLIIGLFMSGSVLTLILGIIVLISMLTPSTYVILIIFER